MRVLVACEFSGIVRDEFSKRGHDAMSCDLLPSERSAGKHYQGDVRDVLNAGWDLMIAHPPCTYLAVSGARWFADKRRQKLQLDALAFIRLLLNAPIHRIALENPIGVISTEIRKPTQIVQPWEYGHAHSKATCLWLKGLPRLQPTAIVIPEWSKHRSAKGSRISRHHEITFQMSPEDRWRERSRTYPGIARAMADQWGTIGDRI